MSWVEPRFSRERVNQAGREYISADSDDLTKAMSRVVIDNWRSAHGFPLNTVQMRLRDLAARVDPSVTVAQRTKRLPSICSKLERFPRMGLARMHDIGGCRAILANVSNLRDVQQALSNPLSRSRNKLAREPYDYIADPKPDGYRGVHLVIRYKGTESTRVFDDMRVEVQLRTKVQHAWATALETVDTYTRQALKSDAGDPQWQRFFTLMGSELALLEGCPAVPGVTGSRNELRAEIRELASELRVIERLQAFGVSTDLVTGSAERGGRYYLMSLDLEERRLRYRKFTNLAQAEDAYAALESGDHTHPLDNVLVGVDSIAALRRAYPNYFLDTSTFISFLRRAVYNRSRPTPRKR